MGLFGGRRKAEQEEAERLRLEQEAERQRYAAQRSAENDRRSAERRARIMGWFEALEKDAAEGAPLLTDEILERVGPFPLPPREWKDREGRLEYVGDLAATKASGRIVARNYMAMAHDKSDAAFWASVNEYCEGVLAGA